jgi:hypothetical protein
MKPVEEAIILPQIEDLDAAKQLIEMQLKDIDTISTKVPYGLEYSFWEDFTAKIIDRVYGNDSRQSHGFEQAGRGGCFSVFDTYSEHQRREDFLEILNCKKEYLENLIKDLDIRIQGFEAKSADEISDTGLDGYSDVFSEETSKTSDASPLDHALYEIFSKIKDPALLKEARLNLIALRNELLKPNPSWANLKHNMIWLIEFGKEEFFSILPFIVLYIRKISD